MRGFLLALALLGGQHAQPARAEAGDEVGILRELLSQDPVDMGAAKIRIDALAGDSTDPKATTKALQDMAAQIRQMAGANAGNREKLTALRAFLFDAGPWNGGKPFEYDQSDPYGAKVSNKLLSSYLASRRGNCVTMPVLYVALAQRLGLDASLSTAPRHLFIRYRDPASGNIYNLEITSGAHVTRDVWYIEKLGIGQEAVEQHAYLQTLSVKENVAVMAQMVAETHVSNGRFAEAIAVEDAILDAYPKFVDAIVMRGNAYGRLLQKEFPGEHAPAVGLDSPHFQRYQFLAERNHADFERAAALGWKPEE